MGVSTETQDPDLATAFAGGDTFLQRMEQLSAAKVAAERAEASLNLGMTARAVMDRYEAKLADAARALDDARKQAQAIVDAAKETAAATIKDGEDQRAVALAHANEARLAADAYAVETRTKADAAMQAANQTNNEADARLANVAAREAAAQSMAADAVSAQADAAAKAKQLDQSLDTLRTACAKVLAPE